MFLKGNMHVVVVAKGFVAIRTLTGPRGQSLFNAFLAEDVATGLDDSILEIPPADGAEGKSLRHCRG